MRYPLAEGVCTVGMICTRQKCPKCSATFVKELNVGLICPTCQTQPTRLYIKIYYGKRHHQIRQDKRGNKLTSNIFAQQVLNAIRVEIRQKIFDPEEYKVEKPYSFPNYWALWIKKYKPGTATRQKIEGLYRNHFGPYFANFDMRDIRRIDFQDFLNTLECSERYKEDMLTWLKTMFKTAYYDEIIEKIPRFPETEGYQEEIPKWLDEEKQERVLSCIPEKHYAIFRFLICTGVRVSEACALMREDIDFSQECIIIKRTFSRRKLIKKNKQRKPNPRYLPPEIAELIKKQPINLAGFVFTNPDGRLTGRHYTEDFLLSLWKKASREAKVEVLQLKNSTRHAWGSQKAAMGFSPEQIAIGLGQSNTKTTKKYIGAVIEMQKLFYSSDNKNSKKSIGATLVQSKDIAS